MRHILAHVPRPSLTVADARGLDALQHASAGDFRECAHLLLTTRARVGFEPRLPLPAAAVCMKKSCSQPFSLLNSQSGCHFCGLVLCTLCAPESFAVFAPRDSKPVSLCVCCFVVRIKHFN